MPACQPCPFNLRHRVAGCVRFVLMAAFVRTLIRLDANKTSTKYSHSIGGMTVCWVRSLESQVVGAC
ncbi:hypothetical protein OUZ56_026413 [Daphnia magna]|uniref:Secreted protein n=1 Tax=Daphnia magna TaxID=35525 RepID=A0ABQ9ZLN8_9CRUS|nr:hypothetical protein OUZ56_026413 [Daphnia magna]